MLRLFTKLTRLGVCVLFATATTAASPESHKPFLVVDMHRTSGPWSLLIKSEKGSYEKLDSSGVSEVIDDRSLSALDAHPPKSAGILSISISEAVASRRDNVFRHQILPALAKYLAAPESELSVRTPPLTTSAIGQDVLKEREYEEDALIFLPFIASYESLRADLDASDEETRRLAVKAATKIPGSRATKLLIAALDNDNETVATMAQKEITRRGLQARATLQAALAPNAAPDDRVLKMLHRVEYDAAISAKTVAAYSEFLSRYPKSGFRDEIRYRLLSSKGDTAGLQKLSDSFPNGGQGDLHDLLDSGALEVYVHGNTSSQFVHGALDGSKIIFYAPQMGLRLRRLVSYPLKVRIPAGTYFASQTAKSQETLVASGKIVPLIDEEMAVEVPAVYVGAFSQYVNDPDPQFTVERAPTDPRLRTLVAALTAGKSAGPIWQAAVWIAGSDAPRGELRSVSKSSGHSGDSVPLISDDDIVAVLRLCEAARIDLSGAAIWLERPRLVASLKDESNKQWLTNQLASELASNATRAYARIEGYEIGTTTIDAFLDDGWTLTDAVSARIGILAYTSSMASVEYLVGTCGMLQDARYQIKEDRSRADLRQRVPQLMSFDWPDGPSVRCEKAYRLKFESSVLRSREKI